MHAVVVPEIDQPELYNVSISFLEPSNIVEQIDFDTTSNNTDNWQISILENTKTSQTQNKKFRANHPVFDFITIEKPTH